MSSIVVKLIERAEPASPVLLFVQESSPAITLYIDLQTARDLHEALQICADAQNAAQESDGGL